MIATLNNNLSIVGCRRIIVCLITTAKDCSQIIAVSAVGKFFSIEYMNSDMTFRCTINVISTKDTA